MNKIESYIKTFVPFIVVFTISRFVEMLMIWHHHKSFTFNVGDVATGFLYDFLSAIVLSALLAPLFLLLSKCNKKIFNIVSHSLLVSLILIQIGLGVFYSYNLYPLDRVILLYPIKDIITIVLTSGGVSVLPVSAFVLIILLYFLFVKVVFGKRILRVYLLLSLVLLALSMSIFKKNYFKLTSDNSSFSNKSMVFYCSLIKSNQHNKTLDLKSNEEIVRNLTGYPPENSNYPLERSFISNNVLEPYFQSSEVKPNVVFLLIEGLSRTFSGPDAKYGSYTPFLDSLSAHSIYFSNFLSNSERTYGVLPNVLGSLPPAVNGFMLANTNMPYHESIITTLKKNNYRSSFFYTGNIDFDNMEYFLYKNGIDTIIDKNKYGEAFSPVGFFRYSDFDLFKKSFEVMGHTMDYPKLLIFLTMGIHEPYIHTTGKLFDQTINEKSDGKLSNGLLKSVMECDYAIKRFFTEYKKREDYKNTIFVLTGDHSPSAINIESSLDNFYVPLIIYSPLLTKSAIIKSISSHLDIYPSLLSLLNSNYGIESSQTCHFMSSGLDTCLSFRNKHLIPLSTVNKTVSKMVWENTFYDGHNAYEISDNLLIKEETDEQVIHTIDKKLSDFNKLDYFILNNDALLNHEEDTNSLNSLIINYFEEASFLNKVKCFKNPEIDSVLIDSMPQFINLLNFTTTETNNAFINITVEFEVKRQSEAGSPLLVVDITSDSTKYYRNDNIIKERTAMKWSKQKCVFSINKKENKINVGSTVKIYIWNPGKCIYKASSLKLQLDK